MRENGDETMTVIPKEWLRLPSEEDTGYLMVTLEGGDKRIPLVVETMNVSVEEVNIGKEQEFYILLEADHDELRYYKDEEEYYAKSNSCLAAESLIPSELFQPDTNAFHYYGGEMVHHFTEITEAIVQGRVLEVCADPASLSSPDDVYFTMACLGYGFIVSCRGEAENMKDLAVDNIVSGSFCVWGWPKNEATE